MRNHKGLLGDQNSEISSETIIDIKCCSYNSKSRVGDFLSEWLPRDPQVENFIDQSIVVKS